MLEKLITSFRRKLLNVAVVKGEREKQVEKTNRTSDSEPESQSFAILGSEHEEFTGDGWFWPESPNRKTTSPVDFATGPVITTVYPSKLHRSPRFECLSQAVLDSIKQEQVPEFILEPSNNRLVLVQG